MVSNKIKNMKQLIPIFLFLLPCFALAQYPSNGNQKITLGEQTTADGLIFRGLAADTIRKPSIDTMAYIILDTATNIQWHYKKAVSNAWVRIGGISVSGTSGQVAYFDGNTSVTGDAGLIYSSANKTLGINTATTSGANLIIKNSQEPARSTFLAQQTFGADTTNWTRGTGWTFNGTLAVATAATGDLTYITLPDTIISGRAYEITYTQSGYISGTATIALGNVTLAIPQYNLTGNIILLLPTSATGGFRITTSTYTGNLDNISIVEISNQSPILFAGQDDVSSTLYNSLRMPNSTTFAFGGGASYTTGNDNVANGGSALLSNTTGTSNIANGLNALRSNTTGSNNVANGTSALQSNTTGINNVANGTNALFSNTTGNNNVANGLNALFSNTTASDNIANGSSALRFNTTGGTNVANGADALRSNTTGSSNVANGVSALQFNTTGGTNVANGTSALRSNTTGSNNVANGTSALRSNTTGNNNVANGLNAMYNTNVSDTLTGSNNIAIGTNAADNIRFEAAGNVAIGNAVDLPIQNGSNQGVYQNALFITGASGTGTNIAGNVGIAVNTPTARLHLAQGTATASTAPLKFTSGTNLTTAEAGAMEFNGTNLFFSPSTTRHTVNHGLTGSATLDFASTNAQNSRDLTIAVTGAADGDVVSLGVPNAAVNANTSYSAWVSAANTVTVRFNNYSIGTVDPASGSFKVFVTK